MRLRARSPSKREILLAIALVGFVGVGMLAGNWFNSQVKVKSATLYGVVLPSEYSTNKHSLYIDAATPTIAYNGNMNITGTSPNLTVEPNGNTSFIVQLNSNLTTGVHEVFYISDIPVTQGVTIRNYSFFTPYPLAYSSGTGQYGQVPYNLEVRLLATSPVGTISWQSYIFYLGYNNYGLSDTRGLTSWFNLGLFAVAAALLWGVVTRTATRKSLPPWFPVGTLALLSVTLFVYVFIGSAFEIGTPGWTNPWTWLALPFSHQGFGHLSGNLPPFLISALALELTLRKFDRRRLYFLAFGLPVAVDYVLQLFADSSGVSVLLGVFAVTIWSLVALYWTDLVDRLGLRWMFGILVASGLALTDVTVNYLSSITISLPFQNPFWVGEAIWHPLLITFMGALVFAILGMDKKGVLGAKVRGIPGFFRKTTLGSLVPILVLLAEFARLTVSPLLPYKGSQLPVVHSITCVNASQWVITPCHPMGQLTSFLVFDGINNVETIVVAAVVVSILSFFIRIEYAWLVTLGFLLVTNLAGVVAPTGIYLAPPMYLADWGMSAASFASLGFAFICALWILFSTLPKGSHKAGRDKLLTILLLGLVLGCLALIPTVNPTVSEVNLWLRTLYVHLLSLSIGLLFGGIVLWGIRRDASARGVVAFERPSVKEPSTR